MPNIRVNQFFLTQALLFGSTLDTETKILILNATIDYILSTKRFEEFFFGIFLIRSHLILEFS